MLLQTAPGSTPDPCQRCPLQLRLWPFRPPYKATVVEGAGDGVREARREFAATGERGIVSSSGGHAAQFRATGPSVHTLSEISANGLVLRETSSSKSSPKVQLWKEICPKCATLDKILVDIQTLGLGKGPLENVLSFPNLKFRLDENNLHRWRCSCTDFLNCLANQVNVLSLLLLARELRRGSEAATRAAGRDGSVIGRWPPTKRRRRPQRGKAMGSQSAL
jgi:hypothetical protein